MITYVIFAIACSVFCLIGFVIGRCFRDFDAIACEQRMIELEQQGDSIQRLLAEGERAMTLLDEYRAKVAEVHAIEREDFASYRAVN